MEVDEIGNVAAHNGRAKDSRPAVLTAHGDRFVDDVKNLVDHQADAPLSLAEHDRLHGVVLGGFGAAGQIQMPAQGDQRQNLTAILHDLPLSTVLDLGPRELLQAVDER